MVIKFQRNMPNHDRVVLVLAHSHVQGVLRFFLGLLHLSQADVGQAHNAFELGLQLGQVDSPQTARQAVVVAATNLFNPSLDGIYVALIVQVKLEGCQRKGEH